MVTPSPVVVLLWIVGFAAAQAPVKCLNNTNSAVVPPWWSSLKNANGIAPCGLANEMLVHCRFPNLTDISQLVSPTQECLCSPLVYDVYGACKACQKGDPENPTDLGSLSDWTSQCSQPTNDSYLASVAPEWAKQMGNDNFDIKQALQYAAEVQVTSTSSSVLMTGVAPVVPSTSSASAGASGVPPTATSSSSGSSKSIVGPVVGGVVAGVVVLAALGGLLFFILRRRKAKRVAPSTEFTRYMQAASLGPSVSRPDGSPTGATRKDSEIMPLTAGEDPDALPAFTPGFYAGPVFEKEGYRADPVSPMYSSPSATVPTQGGSSSHDATYGEGSRAI